MAIVFKTKKQQTLEASEALEEASVMAGIDGLIEENW